MIGHALRITALLVLLGATSGCAATMSPSPRHPRPLPPPVAVHVDVSIFYDGLSPYGRWFTYGSYGWVWTPYDVPYGWRPYSHGRWIYSECGWTWVSYWPWGWAPFHYGRWLFDPDYGWIWVPDPVWGPAWVAWRWSDDWVGWAPLPPDARWRIGVGFHFGDSRPRWERDATCWSFTRPRWLLDANVRYKLEPAGRSVSLFERTRVMAELGEAHGRPFNSGRDVRDVERVTRQRVLRWRLSDAQDPTEAGQPPRNAEARMYRPDVAPAPDKRPPVAERPSAPGAPDDERIRREEAARGVDAYYREERARLERSQRADPGRTDAGRAEELRQRHEAERRALEEQRERERKAREQRVEKRIEKPQPAKPAPPGGTSRGKRKG